FNFEKPRLKLQSEQDAGLDASLEFSDFPGEYLDQQRGTALARIRTEEFQAGRKVGVGQSNSLRLAPACTFTLAEHSTAPLNQEYLVTSILHEGKQAVRRTSAPLNGHAGLLDARSRQSLLAMQRDAN